MHLAVLAHAPGLDRVVVIDRPRAPDGDQALRDWLQVSRAVGDSAWSKRIAPCQFQSKLKRVSAFGSTSPSKRAGRQFRPPSADTSTRLTDPRPLHAKPEMQ